jgi:DNA helicase-2/ATP-dependent DNA helicase PcrA
MIGDEIERASAGRKLNDMAILVRASFQMRAFEERFVTLQIPYKVVGGPRFYRARRNPRRPRLSARDPVAGRRPGLRAHRQHAQARHRRHLGAEAAADRPGADRDLDRRVATRQIIGSDELPARTRTALSNFIRDLDRWRPGRQMPAPASAGDGAGGERLYRRLRLDKGRPARRGWRT